MNRKHIRKLHLSDINENYNFVSGTPEECIMMVWELTKEVCSLSKDFDAEQRLQRHITRVIRRKS